MSTCMLSGIRPLIDGMKGHNYALPDCIKFIFERIGAHDELDFWTIAAITGDVAAPVYSRRFTRREYCTSGYIDSPSYIIDVFGALGYGCEYAPAKEVAADPAGYLRKVASFIERGVPVLVKTYIDDVPGWHSDVGTHCLAVGCDGATLKLLVGGTDTVDYTLGPDCRLDLAFISGKQREVTLADVYKTAIMRMPMWLTMHERDGRLFGAQALRHGLTTSSRADSRTKLLRCGTAYGVYVCNIATSGGEATYIFGSSRAVPRV